MLVVTNRPGDPTTFLDAVRRSVPPGGGLYLPQLEPVGADLDRLLALPFAERSAELLARFIGDEIPKDELRALVHDAFDFPVPLVPLPDGTSVLELFHGPTLAFKDFGARFLARILQWDARRAPASRPRTILTATSGDTGAAVAQAFFGLEGFRVAVLYPAGRVSPLQERQFATLGGNVRAFAVQGSFDDCQALVKGAFADEGLARRHGLTSANSINLARLLAQVAYYFEIAAGRRARDGAPAPVVCVPSGNFGNLCAGLLAARAGLPVRTFVLATNANTTVPEYLDGLAYRPRPSLATLSNAMDVGAPNNWERIEALFGGELRALRSALRWGSLTDDGTLEEIEALYRAGYLADPHTAVAHAVLCARLKPGESGVLLATAHPAKFGGVLRDALGVEVPLPPALAAAAARPLCAEPLGNDPRALAAALDGWS